MININPQRAVLFNSGNVRLGEVSVPVECLLIEFGGGYFVRTETPALTSQAGICGVAFEQSDCWVLGNLDDFSPRPGVKADKIVEHNDAAIRVALGCFEAAEIEGLSQAIAESSDERLKDLLNRRVMHALTALQTTGLLPDVGTEEKVAAR